LKPHQIELVSLVAALVDLDDGLALARHIARRRDGLGKTRHLAEALRRLKLV